MRPLPNGDRRPWRCPFGRPLVPAIVALSIVLAGCVGGDEAEQGHFGDTVPEGTQPARIVHDMSGELPPASVDLGEGAGPLFEAGTVPSGEDDKGTVLIDFQPDPGPAAEEVWICIGTYMGTEGGVMIPDCWEAYAFSSGEAVQLDATGLSGGSILVGTDAGAGAGTTYVLCASVFDFHRPADDYTAMVDGRCHDPAAGEEEDGEEEAALYFTDVVVEENAIEPDCTHVDVFGMGPDPGSDAQVPAQPSDSVSSCPTYFRYVTQDSFTLSGDMVVRFWFACELPKPESDVLHQSFELLVYRNGAQVTPTAESGASGGDLALCPTAATEVRIETALRGPVAFNSGDELTVGIAQYYVNDPDFPGYLYYLVGPSHPSGITVHGLPGQVEEPGVPLADPGAQEAKSTPAAGVALLAGALVAAWRRAQRGIQRERRVMRPAGAKVGSRTYSGLRQSLIMAAAFLVISLAGCLGDGQDAPDPGGTDSTGPQMQGAWPDLTCAPDPSQALPSSIEVVHLETFDWDPGYREELDSMAREDSTYLAVARPGGNAIELLDVTDPRHPALVSTWYGDDGGYADDIKFTPDGQAVISGGRDRLALINYDDVQNPYLEHEYELVGFGAHMVATWTLRNDTYVSISKAEGGDVSIFRIDGPHGTRVFTRMSHLAATPLGDPAVARPDPIRSHDTWFEIDPETGAPLLWVANVYWGIIAYDVDDPGSPTVAATIPNAPPYHGYMHNVQVAHLDGRRLVVGVQEYGTGVLKVWDATDLDAPRHVAYFAPDVVTSAFHNMQIVGHYVLAGHFDEGLYILDLTDIQHGLVPTEMQVFAHAPAAGTREGRVPVGLTQGNFGTQDVEVRNAVVWTSEAQIGVQALAFGCFTLGDPAHTSTG